MPAGFAAILIWVGWPRIREEGSCFQRHFRQHVSANGAHSIEIPLDRPHADIERASTREQGMSIGLPDPAWCDGGARKKRSD